MKKLMSLVLISSLLIGCCACSGKDNGSSDPVSPGETEVTEESVKTDTSSDIINLLNTVPSNGMKGSAFEASLGKDFKLFLKTGDGIMYRNLAAYRADGTDESQIKSYTINGFDTESQMDGDVAFKRLDYSTDSLGYERTTWQAESLYESSFYVTSVYATITTYAEAEAVYESLLTYYKGIYPNISDVRDNAKWIANADNAIKVSDPAKNMFDNDSKLMKQYSEYISTDDNGNEVFIYNPAPQILTMSRLGNGTYEICATNYIAAFDMLEFVESVRDLKAS